MPDAAPPGFLNLDKPRGITSHDVVAQARRRLRVKKVGHAGTLDPLATGVLVVCIGPATRLSEYIMQSTKRYRARVHLGVTTDTYDAGGTVQHQSDAGAITRAALEQALVNFRGEITQVPPMYSALKRDGRRLYDLARRGQVIEREARPVTIHHLEILGWNPQQLELEIACSPGTYIRSLAHDLGAALGVGAHLAALTRTASGQFKLETAITPERLFSAGDWRVFLIPPEVALSDWPAVYLDAAAADDILHGRPVRDADAGDNVLARAHDGEGRFIAIVRGDNGIWRPHKVFSKA